MKKALLVLMVVGAALAGAASSAFAQSVYFGFGTGGGYYPREHYYGGYGGGYNRPYYRRYATYGYSDCYYRTIRRYNDYRGVWVVRRVRVCN